MAIDTTVVNIDFEVQRSNSCKSLKILDLSHWTSFEEGEAAYISIQTPGVTEEQAVVHIFQKERLNIFNTANLNLSDVVDYSFLGPLPDGIYTITVQRCQDDEAAVTKYHFQDCQIRCKVIQKLISIDLTCTPCRRELLDKIQDVILFLDAAQAQTDKCNVEKAMELYRRANVILTRISSPADLLNGSHNCCG